MIKGLQYIMFMYPQHINMKNQIYSVKYNKKNYLISIQSKQTSIEATDHTNSILKKHPLTPYILRHPITIKEDLQVALYDKSKEFKAVYDLSSHPFNSFKKRYFTEIICATEITSTKMNPRTIDNLIHAFTKFIESYSYYAGDPFSTSLKGLNQNHPVILTDLIKYSKEEHSTKLHDRFKHYLTKCNFSPAHQYHHKLKSYSYNKSGNTDFYTQAVKESCNDEEQFIKHRKHILTAENCILNTKHYDSSLIHLFIACELLISQYLITIYKKNGCSNSAIKKDMKRMNSAILIDRVFQSLHILDTKTEGLCHQIDELRLLRNGVVHRGKSVTEGDAKKQFNIVIDFVQQIEIKILKRIHFKPKWGTKIEMKQFKVEGTEFDGTQTILKGKFV